MLSQTAFSTTKERLNAKIGYYREFISELERIPELELPTDEWINKFVEDDTPDSEYAKQIKAGKKVGMRLMCDHIKSQMK
jgi:hypothetical protein